jgi:hypothetical protein
MVAETAPSGAVFVCCWRSEFVAEPGSKRRLHNSSTGFLLNVRFTRKWSFSLGLYNRSLNGKRRPILLKNPVSASSEKFLAAMRGFVITDMRGHK